MTGDPRVEAAARAKVGMQDREVDVLDLMVAERMLAAADAVERPVATRLADALRGALLVVHHETHVGPIGDRPHCRCYAAAAVLAEWDATQETTT